MSNTKQIQLPITILEENLTTSELGSILVLMASPHLNWPTKQIWQQDRTFTKDIASHQRQGIVIVQEDGNISIAFGQREEEAEQVAN